MEADMKRVWRILAILAIPGSVGAATTYKLTLAARPATSQALIRDAEPERDDALYRYRHDMPRHWRDVMFGW
jgi:hypothetical protein